MFIYIFVYTKYTKGEHDMFGEMLYRTIGIEG